MAELQGTSESVVALPNAAPPTAVVAPLVAPPSTATSARQKASGIAVITLVAALALATVSGVFSITGLTTIFVGAYWSVICLGSALELGKLSAVAYLGRHHATAPWGLKAALDLLIATLMGLNAVSAYGFLSKAHIEHAVTGEVTTIARAADIEARISVQAGIVAAIERQIAEISSAISKATEKGRTAGAMRLAEEQRRNRTDLEASRIREAKTLAALQVEKAAADGERRKSDADLGPLKYLAALTGTSDDVVLRYFILLVACLIEPAAILLLLAATRRSTP